MENQITDRPISLEEAKHESDVDFRKRELDLAQEDRSIAWKRLELDHAKGKEFFRNPLLIGILAAFVGLMSNGIVALINGVSENRTERYKAESERIITALDTDGDASKAVENLRLITEAGLLSDEHSNGIKEYLANLERRRQETGQSGLGPGRVTGGGQPDQPVRPYGPLDHRDERLFDHTVTLGDSGPVVTRAQEWLNLHGHLMAPDGIFDLAMDEALQDFASANGIPYSGTLTEKLDLALKQPLINATNIPDPAPDGIKEMVILLAEQHLANHPMEINENMGPWVRYYCRGGHGPNYGWSGCFVSKIIEDAAQVLNIDPPIPYNASVNAIVNSAKEKGLFRSETSLMNDNWTPSAGDLFAVRRGANVWTHVGIVTDVGSDSFSTIEGNTNDEGAREGYEVARRSRGFLKRDFIDIR